MSNESPLRDTIEETRRDVATIKAELANLKDQVSKLVTRPEFTPVKLIVYSLVGSIFTGVVGALLSRVIMK
jgi:hypothetical protein